MSALPSIPDHTLLRPIGRGAYGEVWLARNVMGTPRAVKIVWRRQFDSDRPYEREFAGIQRFEPVSRAADGLVHVLHVGRNDAEDYFYYVMELADSTVPMVQGAWDSRTGAGATVDDLARFGEYEPRTLRSDLRQIGVLPVADGVRVALDVVVGLAKLHERGLVHRDVKPANIIFVEGRAKLADIGLVSRESEGRTFVGTEGYIPPEGPGSPGADLYALGMVLYEGITGYAPDKFPQVPSAWFAEEAETDVLEFHAVVLRACEADKERRYQNAEEMQADLALLQSGQSVRHLRALEARVTRWRRIGWVAAACVAIAVSTALIANWRARLAAESRAKEALMLEQARSSLARAERAEQQSRRQLSAALLEQARATVRSGEMGQRVRTLDAIRRAAAISNNVELRREAVAAFALPDLEFQRELSYGPEYSLSQLDPRFERIAVSRPRGPIEIRSVADGRLLATLPASTNLICYGALWSRDGRFLAANRDHDSNGHRSDLEVWDLQDTPRLVALIRQARWKARAFHPNKPQLVVGRSGGLLTLWDLNTGEEIRQKRFEAAPREIVYSPDGRLTASTYQRKDGWGVSIHDATEGTQICSNIFSSQTLSISWHPDSRSIAFADFSGCIHTMDAASGQSRLLGRHTAEAVNTTFNADGRYLITGAWGRELICWDVLRQARAFSIGLESYVAQFRADGGACAAWTTTGIRLHTFHRPTFFRELGEALSPRVRHATLSSDNQWLAASSDEQLCVWSLTNSGPAAFAGAASDARLYWSADGELFGSRSRPPNAYRWRVSPATSAGSPPNLEPLPLFKPDRFNSLSVQSNRLAWTSDAGTRVGSTSEANVDAGQWLPTAQGVCGLSDDGRWLAIYGPFTPDIAVYRLPEMEMVAAMSCKARVSNFAFSPVGDELAAVSNGQVEFWSTSTWEPTRVATNFTALPGIGLLFERDGQSMWLAQGLRQAGLHDARTFAPLLPLPAGLVPLALSADGTQLVASLDGRRLQIWDLPALRGALATLGLAWDRN